MKLVNDWEFIELHDLFTAPAPMRHRHRSRPRPPDRDPDRDHFCEEWLAHRVWEDDGGRVDPNPAGVAG